MKNYVGYVPYEVAHRGVRSTARASGDRSAVRLTRRGRIVVRLILVFAGILVLAGLVQSQAAADNGQSSSRVVVVREGETLSGILARHAPMHSSVRELREVIRVNGLEGARVYPGQSLVLPS